MFLTRDWTTVGFPPLGPTTFRCMGLLANSRPPCHLCDYEVEEDNDAGQNREDACEEGGQSGRPRKRETRYRNEDGDHYKDDDHDDDIDDEGKDASQPVVLGGRLFYHRVDAA